LKEKPLELQLVLLLSIKIKNQKITLTFKIVIDHLMQILFMIKNMVLEIIEGEAEVLLEKQ
jgi:hypothetical protein